MDKHLQDMLLAMWNRFPGKYRGTVEDVEDPMQAGRLRVKVPAVLGADEVSGWALPCVPFAGDGVGLVTLPEVGAQVWVEFEGGDPSFPIWTGCLWSGSEGSHPLPDAAAEGGHQVRLLRTPKGHELLLDDQDDAESITIRDKHGNEILLNGDGISIVEAGGSSQIVLTDSDITIEVGGSSLTISDSKIELTASSEIALSADSEIALDASSSLKLDASAAHLDGSQVKLGSADSPAVKWTTLMSFLSSHTHTGNMGAPTSPPMSPPSGDSSSVKVG